MFIEDDGTLKLTEQEIRDRAAGKPRKQWGTHLTEACQDWVARQWSPPKKGDTFTDDNGCLYMLCYVGGFTLIDLETGHWWAEPVKQPGSANDPLTKNTWNQMQDYSETTFTPVKVRIEEVE